MFAETAIEILRRKRLDLSSIMPPISEAVKFGIVMFVVFITIFGMFIGGILYWVGLWDTSTQWTLI